MSQMAGDVEAAVLANYVSQREAMVAADATALGQLLSDDFTLTHMTGYTQPRAEWLRDVATGEMTYHSMKDVAVTVRTDHGDPVLTARTRTVATIWGGHGTWPLRLEIHFALESGKWLASHTVASTW